MKSTLLHVIRTVFPAVVVICLIMVFNAHSAEFAPPRLIIQSGHSMAIYGLSVSQDGRLLISAGADATARLWHVPTGRELRILRHPKPVRLATITADGLMAATLCEDGKLRLWDLHSGGLKLEVPCTELKIRQISFSADGLLVRLETENNELLYRSSSTGLPLTDNPPGALFPQTANKSPDGRYKVAIDNKVVILKQIGSDATVLKLTGHTDLIICVLFTSDGRSIITGSNDRTIRVWDARSGEQLRVMGGDTDSLYAVGISRDNDSLVTAGRSGEVYLWDIKSGREARRLNGHPDFIYAAAYSPTENFLATAGEGGDILLWDVKEERLIKTLKGHTGAVGSLVVSGDGSQLLSGGWDGDLRLWDLHTGSQIWMYHHENWILAIYLANDGKKVIFASDDGTIGDVDGVTGHLNQKVPLSLDGKLVMRLCASADGKLVALGTLEGPISVRRTSDWGEVISLIGHDGPVNALAFTNNGKLISGGDDATVRIWDLKDGRKPEIRSDHTSGIQSIALSRDGKFFVTGGYDHSAILWSLAEFKQLASLVSFNDGTGPGDKWENPLPPEFLSHIISSNELSDWLRYVDAGQMALIIDACHSAATVGEGFKAGPMGSRGLGQLAYDKGLRILAASQADDFALESDKLQHGLLTYALTKDGIEAGQADFKPRNSRINLAEWLEYGVDRVPKLYDEVKNNKISAYRGDATRASVVRFNKENSLAKKNLYQTPSLFDFTRGNRDAELVR